MDQLELKGTFESKSKKRKYFLWSLNPEWISGLLQIMSEYVNANMRSAQGFKEIVYRGVAQKLKERFGIEVTAEQCKNQIRHQRTIWIHIHELKKKSSISWDESNKIIIMGNEEYAAHIQAFPRDAIFLNVSIHHYADLEKVCGEGHASGELAKSGNSQGLFGTQHINLDDDENSGYYQTGAAAQQAPDCIEVDMENEQTGSTKRAMPSSSKGSILRKRSKCPSADRSLLEYIGMMADSVAQVANAIQSTTKAVEERKMFTELMTELSSIQGFSEEEIDAIYDNLSKNPTMILSFLSKPAKSKARLMRKELGK